MEIKKLSNIDLLALIRTVSLELENRECGREVTKYVARGIPSTVDEAKPVKFTAEAYSAALKLSKSSNQQRAELIQRARKFVEREIYKRRELAGLEGDEISYALSFFKLEFIVNAKKRRVVALIKSIHSNRVIHKGIAKCMPGDVFHTDIGKAIALAKALQIDIPQEFVDAVQPDEKVIGMMVYDEKTLQLNKLKVVVSGEKWAKDGECHADSISGQRATIIDDTNAEYESVGE